VVLLVGPVVNRWAGDQVGRQMPLQVERKVVDLGSLLQADPVGPLADLVE
jgi:hypothetical protein